MPHPPLRKALGQHHLTDGALCRPLLEFLRPAGRSVVEVGPGGGVLTRELLRAGARPLLAWELDLAWAAELARRGGEWEAGGIPGGGRLHLVIGDAREIPWHRLPEGTLAAGNLPYHVASPIVRHLLPAWRRIPRAGFLVQWEVAERLVAGPGDAAYGALSVLVAAHAQPRLLARVRRGSFHPPPKVDGAFVGLTLHPPPLPEEDMPGFVETVHLAFGHRRKTLANALAAGWGERGRKGRTRGTKKDGEVMGAKERAREVVAAVGLDARVRAEALGVEELVAVSRAVSESG